MAARTWARGITTSYNYDGAGGLTNVAYSDGVTSSVTNTYDRLGRVIQVGMSNQVCKYQYDLAGDLLVETNTVGILAGLAVTNGYDAYRRRTDLTALGSGVLSHTAYGYTNDSRLWTVSDGTNNATYSYVAYSPLVSQITFKSNSVTAMTITKQYDLLNRLTQISNAPSASAAVVFNYAYNSANQRTKDTLIDGSYWVYQYDSLGQVTSGKKYWQDGTPVAGQQFEYTFDDIGNRTSTQSGGDQTGAFLRSANYTNNSLNELTGREVPGYIDIMGIALATNTVTVNTLPAYRKGEYFRKELNVVNTNIAVWVSITNASPGQTTITGNKYLPKTAEVFYYDADGNLTNDGRWIYTWDGENRLIKMTVNTNVGPQYQLLFTYDSKGRRVQKYVSMNSVAISTNRFLYDGWNLIGVLNPNSQLQSSYVWGKDLNGTLQGAGGVGGLLVINVGGTNCFAGFDGNGNVAILGGTAGTNSASYEYGPFGEVVRATGPIAKFNPFRWSNKYQDDESDLLYYGYRYHNVSAGRWLSRDPIEEAGGSNLYLFLLNDSITGIDPVGLQWGGPFNNFDQPTTPFPPPEPVTDPGDPHDYGSHWLNGTGRDAVLGQDSPWTQSMQLSTVMGIDRERMKQKLRYFCTPYVGEAPLTISLGGELGVIPWYEYLYGVFPYEYMNNSVAAFVGSWTSGTITATHVDCCKRTAKIHIHGVNISGRASATHYPPMGSHYGKGHLLDDTTDPTKWGHNISQVFDWDESIWF